MFHISAHGCLVAHDVTDSLTCIEWRMWICPLSMAKQRGRKRTGKKGRRLTASTLIIVVFWAHAVFFSTAWFIVTIHQPPNAMHHSIITSVYSTRPLFRKSGKGFSSVGLSLSFFFWFFLWARPSSIFLGCNSAISALQLAGVVEWVWVPSLSAVPTVLLNWRLAAKKLAEGVLMRTIEGETRNTP